MKNYKLLLALAFTFLISEPFYTQDFKVYRKNEQAAATPNIDPSERFPNDPALKKIASAEITGMNAYGGKRNSIDGIIAKIDLDIKYLKGKKIEVVSWFYFWNGDPESTQRKLIDYNGHYRSKLDQVATSSYYKSTIDKEAKKGLELFIPYNELHLSNGTHYICFDFGIFIDNKYYAGSDYLVGTYRQFWR